MLNLKVFTHKNIHVSVMDVMTARDVDIKEHSNTDLYIETMSSIRKTMSNSKIKVKAVDKIFEFKSFSGKADADIEKKDDTDREEDVFQQIREHLEKVNIKYVPSDLEDAFNFIQKIRRNKYLENVITDFNKETIVQDFISSIKKNASKQKYYHLYPFEYNPLVSIEKSNYIYRYFFYSEYFKSNVIMPKEIEELIIKIINKNKIDRRLKSILVDLLFCGVIPLDEILPKPPIILEKDEDYLSMHILEKVNKKDIENFIKENNDIFINLKRGRVKKISQRDLDIFDYELKYFHQSIYDEHKKHQLIASMINAKYHEDLDLDTPKKNSSIVQKKINSFFSPKQ